MAVQGAPQGASADTKAGFDERLKRRQEDVAPVEDTEKFARAENVPKPPQRQTAEKVEAVIETKPSIEARGRKAQEGGTEQDGASKH